MATPQESSEDEKETKLFVDNSDFTFLHCRYITQNEEEMLKEAASEALKKNIINLKKAISGSAFQDVVLACEQKELILTDFKNNLLDTSSTRTIDMKAADLVREMQNIVSFRPDCIDTFLCVLTQHGGIPGITVAEAIAKDYGHTLPNYERSFPTSTETVIAHDDLMSNEDHPSIVGVTTTYSTAKMVVFGCIVLTLLITAFTCIYLYMNYEGSEIKITIDDKHTMTKPTQHGSVLLSLHEPIVQQTSTVTGRLMSYMKYFHKRKDEL